MSDQAPHHLTPALLRDFAERCYSWLEALAEGCVVVDALLAVRYCNAAFASIWGHTAVDLLGASLTATLPGFTGSICHRLCERTLLDGRLQEGDAQLGDRWYQVRAHPVPDGVLLLLGDVTGRRRAEADLLETARMEQARLQHRLHEAQKLESLDVLVGGVAHDLNNLLVGMLSGAELLVRDLPEGSALRPTADMICKAALRAREVARQMVVYARKGRSLRRPFDFNRLVGENLTLLQASLPERVRFEAVLHEGLPSVPADAAQMQQVVLNLLMNAAEALPATGGTVRVTTGVAADAEPGVPAAAGTVAGYVFVEVADDGVGMTPEVQARIFEPFFTTKATGNGLGLAAVQNILLAHDGVIRLTTAPGTGTTFRIYLPIERQDRPPEPQAGQEPLAAPTGEVLVVDDEPHVCDIVQRMLHNAGFRCRAVSSGEAALALVRDHPEIHVVILDLKMPVMNGRETLGRLLEIRPQLKAILTSGCSVDQLPDRNDPRLVGFLPKPYAFEQLVMLVRQGFAQLARP